ncbi:1-deoxy-D-xylulose-5-phosphate reductoisomerase [Aquisphaera insulae]|uniref:1-deoxy-D-xylulose-5-phosphate reductoisomerase n=1 Tax=Aquisphaera insulae TaxID=2712864 RepID=UPI0013ED4E2C|nr:1-deoxy-D-xylulose-5-phosphate reductoisomerase [Aquisphaera insulae]
MKPGDSLTRVVILGSTGSIGRNGLDVIEHDAGKRLRAWGLSGHRSRETLLAQCRAHRPRFVAVTDPDSARAIREDLRGLDLDILEGRDGIIRMVQDPATDRVLSAIVGVAGLEGTWAALEAGKTVALANKESLVVAGPLVMELAGRRGGRLLPVDSEHSAIFQALRSGEHAEVKRVILTSSGGPFRGRSRRELQSVTPDEALRHPTWKMGPKITIDSATLMNKALEVIEARWLFGLEPDQVEVVIHPESVVHSMVEFVDGSVIAQLSPPDMRLPIQYALTYPDRVPCPGPRVDLTKALALHFEPPDRDTFPCLDLGFEVMSRGGTAGAALNAANEAAVARFLGSEIGFLDIPRACRAAIDHHTFDPSPSLDQLWKVDAAARLEVQRWQP